MKFIKRYSGSVFYSYINPDLFYLSDSEVYFSKNFEEESLVLSAKGRRLVVYKLNNRFSVIENNTDNLFYIIDNESKEISQKNIPNLKFLIKHSENYILAKFNNKVIGIVSIDDILSPLWTKQIDDLLFNFGDDQYLLYTEFNNRYKITCLSVLNGQELWSRDFKGQYWKSNGDDRVDQKILSSNVGLYDGKVILHFTPGLMALDLNTGETIWDDVKQNFYGENTFKLYKDKIYQFIAEYQEDIQSIKYYLRVVDIDTGKDLDIISVKNIIPDFDQLFCSPLSHINERYCTTEKFIIFSDWVYIYVIDRLTLVLLDSIKIPYEQNKFYAGAYESPVCEDGYLIYLTHGNKDRVDILVFRLEEDLINN
ncbi:MAG TPA: hypothetical protein VK169_13045 [Saprospiraceae bacterium]|nr:hypothetical protein [Saprospiraceae bacterium]